MFEMRQISTEFKWQLAQIRQCWRWAQSDCDAWDWAQFQMVLSHILRSCLFQEIKFTTYLFAWKMLNQFGLTRAICFNNELIQVILSASRIPPGREGLKKVNLLICIEYGWLIDVLHLILVQIVDSLGTADNVDIVSILDRWKSLGGKTCFEIWGNGELSYA